MIELNTHRRFLIRCYKTYAHEQLHDLFNYLVLNLPLKLVTSKIPTSFQ